MNTPQLPERAPAQDDAWRQSAPNPDTDPEYFSTVTVKRAIAYIVDVLIIAMIAVAIAVIAFVPIVLTLGLLKPLVVGVMTLIPLAYHTLLIGGERSATMGMRLLAIEVRKLDGGKPGYILALIQTVTFYVTVGLTTWLILLVALFNQRHRTLHDFLCGTMVINIVPAGIRVPDPHVRERA